MWAGHWASDNFLASRHASYNMLWGYRMAARQILLPWIGNKVLRGYSTSGSFVVLYDICMQNKSHWMERGGGSRNKSSPSQWKMTHPTPKHLKMLFFCLAPNICLATIYLTLNFFFNIGILTIKRIWSNEKQKCLVHLWQYFYSRAIFYKNFYLGSNGLELTWKFLLAGSYFSQFTLILKGILKISVLNFIQF